MRTTTGWAQLREGAGLERWTFERRDPRPEDVVVRVTHCGVCHTDLHALDAAGAGQGGLPLVPGHEFVGEVVEVGPAVTDRRVGDRVAVGNIVDSCGTCTACRAGDEPYCAEFPVTTYGGRDRHDGTTTRGAYAEEYVVRADFTYPLPEGLDPAGAAPLMCAGVTVWQPLSHLGVGAGTAVGVVGLGGLGHLAVKFAAALGAEVTVFTTSPGKEELARGLGATHVVVSGDEPAMASVAQTLDVVIDTVAADHALEPYLGALRIDGTLVVLALPPEGWKVEPMAIIPRRRLMGSGSGGRPDTAAMLAFAAEHGVVADVEVLPASEVGEALRRLRANDVRFRFVLEMPEPA
jgi:alcohol dehydrogenase (NADP+)